ncbi:MAG: hypothetical protein JNL24_14665 [Bacteroidia bacterium]|nr:hypothetical protein [Bacteroidia bacterium]
MESFLGHYFNPRLLSITHILALGWGGIMIFGALYQLLPVIVNSKLYNIKLGFVAFVFILLGVFLLSFCFWSFNVGVLMQIAAPILLIGVFLFSINVFMTSAPKKKTIEYEFVVSAILWLLVTCIVGVLMVFNFEYVFLSREHLHYLTLHAHVGAFGFFLLLIIGVSSKLIPMFLLSTPISNSSLVYSFYAINLGLVLILSDGFVFGSIDRIFFYALLIFTGILTYLYFIYSAYKSRVRRVLDIPMRKSMLAFIFILLLVFFYISTYALGSIEYTFRFIVSTGLLFFMGFISILIFGQTFKTFPFIVWIAKFKDTKNRKILPKDLYSEKLLQFQLPVFFIGFLVFLLGILAQNIQLLYCGAILFVITALLFFINVMKIVLYKS